MSHGGATSENSVGSAVPPTDPPPLVDLPVHFPHAAVIFYSVIPSPTVDLKTLPNYGNFLWVFPDLKQELHDVLGEWAFDSGSRIRMRKGPPSALRAEQECLQGIFEGGWDNYMQPGLVADIPTPSTFYAFRKRMPSLVLRRYRFLDCWASLPPLQAPTHAVILTRTRTFEPAALYCIPYPAFPPQLHSYLFGESLVNMPNIEVGTAPSLKPYQYLLDSMLRYNLPLISRPWDVYCLARCSFPAQIHSPGRLYVILDPSENRNKWWV